MIEAQQLTKRFGGRTAIDGVTLRVARGEVVGFLGPNGAGKSTTFRILAGVFPPNAGRVTIDGLDLERAPLAARRRIGYVPERQGLHPDLTVEDELIHVALLRDVPATDRRRTVDDAIARAHADDVRHRRIGALSRGMRQRVSLGAALVGDPPALLLDEPTVGLDPAQNAETRRLIRELGRDRAVLVSSHVLGELESLCDRVIVLHHGRILAEREPSALAPRLRRSTWVDVEADVTPERLAALLDGTAGVRRVETSTRVETGRCRVEVAADRDVRAAIAARLAGAGIALYALVPVEPSLEEAFLSLVRDPSDEESDRVTKALAIARRDLRLLFGGTLAWTLVGAFTFLAGYFFYTDLTFYVLFGGGNLPAGLWRYVFMHDRLVALLVLPLVTMRLVAEERQLGALELLWSLPVRDRDVLMGKLVAAVVVYLVMLAGSAIGPAVLWALHPYPLAPLAAGYVGLLLLGLAFIACGLAASCVGDNQVVSAMLTYGVLLFLWFVSANAAAVGGLDWILIGLSLFDRFYGFAQGVIDFRDVVFFLAFTALFVFLALRALGARAWRGVV